MHVPSSFVKSLACGISFQLILAMQPFTGANALCQTNPSNFQQAVVEGLRQNLAHFSSEYEKGLSVRINTDSNEGGESLLQFNGDQVLVDDRGSDGSRTIFCRNTNYEFFVEYDKASSEPRLNGINLIGAGEIEVSSIPTAIHYAKEKFGSNPFFLGWNEYGISIDSVLQFAEVSGVSDLKELVYDNSESVEATIQVPALDQGKFRCRSIKLTIQPSIGYAIREYRCAFFDNKERPIIVT